MFVSQSLNEIKKQLLYDFLEEFDMKSTVFNPWKDYIFSKTVFKQNKSREYPTSIALKLTWEEVCNFSEVQLIQCFVSTVKSRYMF